MASWPATHGRPQAETDDVEGGGGGFSAAPVSAPLLPQDEHSLPAAAGRVVLHVSHRIAVTCLFAEVTVFSFAAVRF